jgi:hypothetical protein
MESTQAQNTSEVARLLQQIREQYESAKLGLSGLAEGTTQHQVITAKMERIGDLHEELRTHVGDEAIAMIVQQLEVPVGNGLTL